MMTTIIFFIGMIVGIIASWIFSDGRIKGFKKENSELKSNLETAQRLLKRMKS